MSKIKEYIIDDYFFKNIFDNFLSIVLIVDENCNILFFNSTAQNYAESNNFCISETTFCGAFFGCIEYSSNLKCCKNKDKCEFCELRNTIQSLLNTDISVKNKYLTLVVKKDGVKRELFLRVTGSKIEISRKKEYY